MYTIKDATVLVDSGKAIKVEAPDLDEPVWVPKSVIHDDSEIWEGGQETGDLVVQDWWAEKEGWE